MTHLIKAAAAAGLLLFGAACMQDSPAAPTTAEVTMVRVDGASFPVRLTGNEPYFMAIGDEGLVPDGRTGPGIRVGGTEDGLLAAHVLGAFCSGAADYRTAAVDPSTLFGSYGDIYWQDEATREWVFPTPDCRD